MLQERKQKNERLGDNGKENEKKMRKLACLETVVLLFDEERKHLDSGAVSHYIDLIVTVSREPHDALNLPHEIFSTRKQKASADDQAAASLTAAETRPLSA
jgi:ABC-type histidine transport system ATPase subunit